MVNLERSVLWKAHFELGQTCLKLQKMEFIHEALEHYHKCYSTASSQEEINLTEGFFI